MTVTQTEIEVTVDTNVEQTPGHYDNRDNMRHIVNPPDNPHISYGHPDMEAQEVVDIAREKGIPVKALCGVEFIPKKDPSTVDKTCNVCLDIAGQIMSEES